MKYKLVLSQNSDNISIHTREKQISIVYTWAGLRVTMNLLPFRPNLLAVSSTVSGTGVDTFPLPRFDAAATRSAAHGPV